jgi:hypothetical protein
VQLLEVVRTMAFEGHVFVVTGTVDEDLLANIKSEGGTTAKSVTKKVTHCLLGASGLMFGHVMGRGSSKHKACEKKGLPVWDVECVQSILDGVDIEEAQDDMEQRQEGDAKAENTTRTRAAEETEAFLKKTRKVTKKQIAEEKKLVTDCRDEVAGRTGAALKDLLRLNGMKTTGAKRELLDRASDAMAFGALPRCPQCAGGYLRVAYEGGKFGHGGLGLFSCPGSFDDDTFVHCDFTSYNVSRPAWRTQSSNN